MGKISQTLKKGKAAADDGIRLMRLDGAGNLSACMMRKHGVMRHYKGLMKKFNAGEEQLIGYHTDFGGRIELIQQGYDEHGICHKPDEKSSYPHKCVILPSMIGGFWVKREWSESEAAEKNLRRLDGHNQLPKIILGVKFTDGIEVVKPKAQAAAA